jgi:putative DNA primase/helicase
LNGPFFVYFVYFVIFLRTSHPFMEQLMLIFCSKSGSKPQNPTETMKNLKLFTQPDILRCIGARRLGILLRPFAAELQAVNFPMPPPDEPDGNGYFHVLAEAISRTDALPKSVHMALVTIETAAAPESNAHLEDAIVRRLSTVSVSPHCILDRALEVWFVAPEELAPFAPPDESDATSAAAPFSSGGQSGSDGGEGAGERTPTALAPLASSGGEGLGERRPTAPVHDELSASSPPAPIENQKPKIENPPRSDAAAILDALLATVSRFAVLPRWVPETVALFIFHTFAWQLRDITAYLGIESPQHRCGKSTLLAIIRRLCNRPEGAAHISGPAVFRAIHRGKPTLLVDETEKVMKRNQLLQGILNASYSRELAYVIRVIPQSKKRSNGEQPEPLYIPLEAYQSSSSVSSLAPCEGERAGGEGNSPLNHQPSIINSSDDDVARFSCWCPKAMAQIGHFPETLADRCIIITMQRKTTVEKCDRVRNLKETDTAELRRRCAEFVEQHREAIANAEPAIPQELNDRAADIWEPLFVLADLAGGDWPQKARQAALALSGAEQSNNLISSLLLDCLVLFIHNKTERLFTRDLVRELNTMGPRPWRELAKGKPIDDLWLARQLRPFGIRPQAFRIEQQLGKGYSHEDFVEPTRRYVSKADWEAYLDTIQTKEEPTPETPKG